MHITALVKVARTAKRFARSIPYQKDMVLHRGELFFFCPCCQMRFRRARTWNPDDYKDQFNPKRYENTRKDIMCPYCGSFPRHRILASWLDEHKEILRSEEILYFSIEGSMMLWLDRNRIPYTTAELNGNAELKIDIQDTGLAEGRYGIVICNHVLEHVEDFRKALAEIYRILKPDGMLICSFPMDPEIEVLDEDPTVTTPEERIQQYGQDNHRRVFGMKAGQLMKEAGYEVEEIRGEDYAEEILPVIGPANYDMNILFYCKKTGKRE